MSGNRAVAYKGPGEVEVINTDYPTFELKDESAKEAAKDKEAEARDIVLALLGKKTIDQLTDISQRDQIKKEVLAAVAPLFPKGTVTKVFFPQFVIQ